MNPNTAQTLDPKLKEAYDRVMGTGISPKGGDTPPVMTASVTPQTTPQVPEKDDSKIEMVNINSSAAEPSAAPLTTPQPAVSAKKNKIRPVAFIGAGVLFFLLYTFIWLKFFSII